MRAIVWRMPKFLVVVALVGIIFLGVTWSTRRNAGLRDFGSFYASGQAANAGLDPFASYPLTFHVKVGFLEGNAPNLNPPASVLAFQSLAHFDPQIAFGVWYVLSFIFYTLAVFLLARAYNTLSSSLRLVWAFSLAALWHTLELGQIYTLLLLLTVGAWLLLRANRPILAGVLIGLLIAIKPHFAIWAVLLLLAGHRRSALSAIASAAAFTLLPLPFYGPIIYREWLEASASSMATDMALWPGNSSLPAITAHLSVYWLGLGLGAVLALGLAMWSWHQRPTPLAISTLAIVAGLLISPITWTGYTMLVLPIFFARRWTLPLTLAATILVFPVPLLLQGFLLSPWLFLLLGPFYGWALLLLLATLTREILQQEVALCSA